MRAEEKLVEGPELERDVETARELESEERELEELPALANEEVRDAELQHRSRLFDALRVILSRDKLTVSLLGLPQRETLALEAIQTAVEGRSVHGNQFVFAEDRAVMLEQALAVLQANLTYGDAAELAEFHGKYDELVGQIGELRETLVDLEDAQDDLFDEKRQYLEEKADGDESDEEAPAEDVEADEKPKAKSPILGEDASITDLVGAALLAIAEVRPDAPPDAKAATPKVKVVKSKKAVAPVAPVVEPARDSSLYGDDLPARPDFVSTLGDEPPSPPPDKPKGKPPLGRRGKRG